MDKKIENIIKKSQIEPSNQMISKLKQFYNLLIEGNKVCNLTAIVDEDEVIEKHFFDSIYPQNYFKQNSKVIDVGTGAGFPSIPLKIVRDDLDLTLLDSLNKRVNFLNNSIDNLNLTKINAIHGRAEDFAKNIEYREKFDVATARAVANLKVLSEYCLPFVKVGGKFIAYKSLNCEEEVKQASDMITELGGKINSIINYKIGENTRNLVIIDKIKPTPNKFPRPANKIKKS